MEHCAPAIASGVVSSDSSRTLPSPSTSRQAVRMDEKLPNAAPDPCVDVATAPAMVCVSMSPWFCSASPASHKGAPNWAMVVCALAVAVRALASIAESPLNARVSSKIPSVQATPVQECPVPGVLRRKPERRASRTASTTSCSWDAVTILAGTQLWLPTQLRQLGLARWKPVMGAVMLGWSSLAGGISQHLVLTRLSTLRRRYVVTSNFAYPRNSVSSGERWNGCVFAQWSTVPRGRNRDPLRERNCPASFQS